MMTDDKFLEKANKFLIMEDHQPSPKEGQKHAKFYTMDEYRTATEALQKNKDGKLVIIYTTDPVQQDAYIQACMQKVIKW